MLMIAKYNDSNKINFLNIFLPTNFLFIIVSSTYFFSSAIYGDMRWLFLLLAILYLVLNKLLIRFIDFKLFFILIFYVAWCCFTSFWSSVPDLSIAKSILFGSVIFSYVSLGVVWSKKHAIEKSLSYLLPFSIFLILSSYIGYIYDNPFSMIRENIVLYQGMLNGANMQGIALAMSLPYLFLQTYFCWEKKVYRFFWLGLLLSCAIFLVLSCSRSSILCASITFLGFLLSIKNIKKLSLIFILIMPLMIAFSMNQNKFFDYAHQLFYKSTSQEQLGLFNSRIDNWQQSYQAALQGGLSGIGLGASSGEDNFHFGFNLTSSNYGREKGNSQLAIIEETGLIGLLLYVMLLSALFIKMCTLFFKARHTENKVVVGVISATIIGMIVQSFFEAWWTSPGSPESIYFWTLVGVLRGLEIKVNKERCGYAKPLLEKKIGYADLRMG